MSVGGPSAPNAEDPLLGKVLSERYRILRKIGEGGMGVVYLAEHVVIEKKIALKILFPDLTRRSDIVRRFMQEAKSASRIGHENVIDITDFGQSPEGYVFIAMEYLNGQDLGHLLKGLGGPMPWPRAQPILLQIAKALRAAHERGIVHRDMKPENVFILPRDDGREVVKVLDFGIAKVLGLDEDAPRLTRTGMIFGTPEYMSPEQAQGQQVDHRVDIYAVGCIMYHMLTGDVPFRAESFMGILSKHMMETPTPPRERNPDIGHDVEAVIGHAMQKDPAKRFQTMRELVDALIPLGSIPDASGAYSLSTGMPIARGGDLSGPQPVARTARPATRQDPPSGPLPHATHQLEGRGTTPLAQSNPEVRRSETAYFSRDGEDRPPVKKSSNTVLIVVGVGTLVLVAAVFAILRGRHSSSDAASGAASGAAIGAMKDPAAAPAAPGADPAAPSVAPPPSAVLPPPAPAPLVPAIAAPPAGEATATAGAGTKKGPVPAGGVAGARRRRTSKEAVDSLMPGNSGESPHVRKTPDELKNPFAPGTQP